jgi:hypothetical protein
VSHLCQESALHLASATGLKFLRLLFHLMKAQFAAMVEFGFLVSVPSWAVQVHTYAYGRLTFRLALSPIPALGSPQDTAAAAIVAAIAGSAFDIEIPPTMAFWGSGNESGVMLHMGLQSTEPILELLRNCGVESCHVAEGCCRHRLPPCAGPRSRPTPAWPASCSPSLVCTTQTPWPRCSRTPGRAFGRRSR